MVRVGRDLKYHLLQIKTIRWFQAAINTELFFHTRTGFNSRWNNCRKANGEYTCGEYSCLISPHLTIQMKMKFFFFLFFISFSEACFCYGRVLLKSRVRCIYIYINQVLCFWTETMSSLGNRLICYSLAPTLTLPTPFKYHTLHLCGLVREKGIWLRKSYTKHALSPLLPCFSRCGDLTPRSP